jgi:hypothetical protein
MGKLFVRERRQVEQGAGIPRFMIVAAIGTDLRVYAHHFRKVELEKLAEEAGAEIVYLPQGEGAGRESHHSETRHAHDADEAGNREDDNKIEERFGDPGHRQGQRHGRRNAMDQE